MSIHSLRTKKERIVKKEVVESYEQFISDIKKTYKDVMHEPVPKSVLSQHQSLADILIKKFFK